jgi:S1-C subfamily serine protease
MLLALAGPAAAQTSQSGSQSTPRYSLGAFGDFTSRGMLLGQIQPGSASERAGLVAGDLIVKMGNKAIQNQQDLVQAIESSGGSLPLLVLRGATGRLERLTLDFGAPAGPRGPAPYLLGILGDYTPQGMFIRIVGPGTPAQRIGLQPGDRISRINGRLITNQDALFQALYSSGGGVDLVVVKGNSGAVVRRHASLRVYQLGVLGDFTPQGVLVGLVAPNTPAATVGLERGDLIVSIDNRRIRSQDDFLNVVNNSAGKVVLVVRQKSGNQVRLPVNLMNNLLGAWCEAAPAGMRVTSVAEDTPAERAGLQRGDVILRVDGQPVRTQDTFLAALDRARGTTTLRVRQAQTGQVARVEVDLSKLQ